ncbi:MAG TPA: phosphatase PAP2 family protein [Cyclobacteriaceae bacterium]
MYSFKKEILFSVSILLVLSSIFWLTDLDIFFSGAFYSIHEGWFMKNDQPWKFLYEFGSVPAMLLGIGSLIFIPLSLSKIKYAGFRKYALFMVLCLAIGPGILVNLVFKDNFGRPRPRDVSAFEGKEEYVVLWVPNFSGDGKSFPCGHCSMGFYLALPFFFLRIRKKRLAYVFLMLGLTMGLAIGYSRIVAGGHFLSDVLWSGGFVWLTGLSMFYLLKLTKTETRPKVISPKKAGLVALISVILTPLAIASLLIATPYYERKEVPLQVEQTSFLKMDLELGDYVIRKGENLKVTYDANGFGFPTSKYIIGWDVGDTSTFKLYKIGWFTELSAEGEIILPFEKYSNRLTLKSGNFYFYLPEKISSNTELEIENGHLHLYPPAKIQYSTNVEVTTKQENNLQYSMNFSVKNGEIIYHSIQEEP